MRKRKSSSRKARRFTSSYFLISCLLRVVSVFRGSAFVVVSNAAENLTTKHTNYTKKTRKEICPRNTRKRNLPAKYAKKKLPAKYAKKREMKKRFALPFRVLSRISRAVFLFRWQFFSRAISPVYLTNAAGIGLSVDDPNGIASTPPVVFKIHHTPSR